MFAHVIYEIEKQAIGSEKRPRGKPFYCIYPSLNRKSFYQTLSRLNHLNSGVKRCRRSLVITQYKHKPPRSGDTVTQFPGNGSICLPSASQQVIGRLVLVANANVQRAAEENRVNVLKKIKHDARNWWFGAEKNKNKFQNTHKIWNGFNFYDWARKLTQMCKTPPKNIIYNEWVSQSLTAYRV